jgi:hypothetical protein
MTMVLAIAVDVVERLAIPIGIVLAAVAVLAIPQLRKGILDSFSAGHQAGAKFGKRDGEVPKSDRE